MLDRATLEAVFREAVAACDPAALVRDAVASPAIEARLAGKRVVGLAIGKAALAMARGLGGVERGLAVVPHASSRDARLPRGWRVIEAAHPIPDASSLAAGRQVVELVEGATAGDAVVALISGGASALIEDPVIPLDAFVRLARAVMASGAPIQDLNTVRSALSRLKAGRLALASHVPVTTLAISDVVGDDLAVIGSGPTVGPWLDRAAPVDAGAHHDALRERARVILAERGLGLMPLEIPVPSELVERDDLALLVAPLRHAADAAVVALERRGLRARCEEEPMTGTTSELAAHFAFRSRTDEVVVGWGEPTIVLPPDPREGGRAQQLALELAGYLSGSSNRSALVAGTDGVDGPPPGARPAPAGAFVDGATCDRIRAAGLDPSWALRRCDAGTVLDAIGALVVTGATGVNHADLVLIG